MPIEFRCDQCQRLLRVPDEHAGGNARCPGCSHIQPVPQPGSGTRGPVESTGPNAVPPTRPSSHAGGSVPFGTGTSAGGTSNPFAESPQQNPFSDNPYESPYAAGYNPAPITREAVRSKVMAPAIVLLIFGILGSGMIAFVMIAGLVDIADNGADEDAMFGMLICGAALLMQLLVVIGSARMLMLKNYGLAMTAAILSMVCGLCTILIIPFSIWALVVLCDTNVKAHFS